MQAAAEKCSLKAFGWIADPATVMQRAPTQWKVDSMKAESTKDILIVYYSRTGHVAQLARLVARGVEEVPGMRARVRSVPPVAAVTEIAAPPVPAEGAP